MGVTCIYHFPTESIDKIHSVSLEVPYDNNRKKYVEAVTIIMLMVSVHPM